MDEAAQKENLTALEGLMNEFFLPTTSNERKRSIEELLNNFSQQKDAWKYCLMFITRTSNEYVMMYCLSVLETLINKQWHGQQTEDKRVIRESICEILVASHTRLPSFIVNKMAKLKVDIARHDWPHFYHNFLTDLIHLMQRSDTAGLGVTLIQMTSEEMAHPREDLSMSRKQELLQLLLDNMSVILKSLAHILNGILERHKLLATEGPTTPPPSPSSGSRLISTPQTTSSGVNEESIFQSPVNKPGLGPGGGGSLLPLDKSSRQLSAQVLSCLSHLFSWIPLSNVITSSLLNSVFSFAAFGCESRQSLITADNSSNQSLGMLAMGCINELLSKNCVPQDFESYLLQLFQQTFYLLKKLTRLSSSELDSLDSSFLDKFTEFVHLFVSHHLRRFESNPQFPVLEFLSLLFDYTFKESTTEEFFACLEIWQIFIDYIKTKLNDRITKDTSMLRYYDGIIALVRQLLKQMQFKHNYKQLDSMDNQDADDDGLTELQTFMSHCNDTLGTIAELIPDDVIKEIDTLYSELVPAYYNLPDVMSRPSELTSDRLRHISVSLRDLSATLQASARMVASCTGEHFAGRFQHTSELAKSLIQLAAYNENRRWYKAENLPSAVAVSTLTFHFSEVYSQTLATLKAYCQWLAQYYIESYHTAATREQCSGVITALVNCVLPTVHPEVPAVVQEWSVSLLSSILTTIRAAYLLDIPLVQHLYTKVSQGYSSSLPPKVGMMLRNCLSSYFILRWPALPDTEQKWDTRKENHRQYIHSLHPLYLELSSELAQLMPKSAPAQQAKPVVLDALTSLYSLVSCISEESSRTKEIMFKSMEDHIQLSLQLFSIFITDSEVLEKILQFFHILIKSLRLQMGVPFTEQTVQTFLSLFTKERLVEIIGQENQTAYRVIESFLQMLKLIVQESSTAFRSLLPRIISICMEHVYPLIAPKPNPDIKLPLYELLYEILNNNWKYFYKSSVKVTFGSVNPSEPLSHQKEFVEILHAFGQSFVQPDINVFKHNLEALEKLNQKWKLYHKTVFLEGMMSQFLNVLLQALVVKSHDLLQDDIITAVYNMASVDFSMFYKTFIPMFLKQVSTIDFYQKETLNDNLTPEDKDLPSFTTGISRMVNDLRYYTIVNASLPPGTIDLSQKEPEPISEY